MNRVFRFHAAAELPVLTEPVLLRKRRRQTSTPFRLVAADTKSVTDEEGRGPLESYRAVSGSRSVSEWSAPA